MLFYFRLRRLKIRKNERKKMLELESFTKRSFRSCVNSARTRSGTTDWEPAELSDPRPILKMSLNGCKNKR
jgi:hypothetical protein